MAYDVLQETTPSRSSKEYLKILKLAAEEGEVQVDDALRELLEGDKEAVIAVESIRELLAKLDTIGAGDDGGSGAGGPGQLRPVVRGGAAMSAGTDVCQP